MAYSSVTPAATQAVASIMAVLDELPTGDRLLALRSLAVLLGTRRASSVLRARADGFSWGEIGDRLGMSRQSVWDRYRLEEERMSAGGNAQQRSQGFADRPYSSCAAYKAVTRAPTEF